jgi:hypothetical protein
VNQRKDTYRAALRRRPDTAASAPATPGAPAPDSAPTTLTPLATRYVKVVIELDPALPHDIVRWAGQPLDALVRAGAAVLRPLRQNR